MPKGIIEFKKENSQSGVILIMGQLLNNDNQYFEDLNLIGSIIQSKNNNILLINLDKKNYTLAQLKDVISEFTARNNNITIVAGIHGFQIFPWVKHEISLKPFIDNGYIAEYLGSYASTYLHGHYINSADLLQVIGQALNNKPVDFWQCSCQGSKLIEDTQNFLPSGSKFVTESLGYVTRPDLLLSPVRDSFIEDHKFSIDDLFLKYAYSLKTKYNFNNLNYANYALRKSYINSHRTN